MPALAVFVPCYPWIGLNGIAAIVAVAPSKTTRGAVTERASDPALDAMARVFRLPAWQRLRHVTLPQLLAFLVRMVRNRLT